MSDASELQQLIGDYEVSKTLLVVPYPYVDGEAEKFIASVTADRAGQASVHWAITLAGSMIGGAGVGISEATRSGTVGYWLGRDYWGQGYMTEALRAILRYCFERRGLKSVLACHFASNPASGRVMTKAGMTQSHVCQRAYETKEGIQDAVHYQITVDQWRKIESLASNSDARQF